MANASPTDLVTLADFKTLQNVSGTADDDLIQKIITSATAWIEGLTNRKLVARRYNGAAAVAPDNVHPTTRVLDEDYFYFDGDPQEVDRMGYGLHYLPQYPIQANTVLTFNLAVLSSRDDVSTTGDDWDTTSLKEGRDYIVDRVAGSIRLLGGPFAWGMKNYRVTCAAGYMLPPGTTTPPWVPADLQQVCVELANQIYRDKRGLKSESIGTWSREFDTTRDDPLVSSILANYSRVLLF